MGPRGVAHCVVGAIVALLLVFALAAPPHQSVNYSGPNQEAATKAQQVLPQSASLTQQAQESPLYKQPCRDTAQDRQSDLCAQWKSADWTKIGTIVAIFGIIVLLIQVGLGWEAIKDTGKATQAMQHANEIAKHTQRPWLKIEVELTEASFEHDLLGLRYSVKVTNLGKMVAERCSIRGKLVERDDLPGGQQSIALLREQTERIAGMTEEGPIMPYPILPGETHTEISWNERSGDFEGREISSKSVRGVLIYFVCVRYHIPGETEIRKTDRAFRIDYIPEGGDPTFDGFGIPLPIPNDFSLERVRLRSAGHNRTT